METNRIFIMKDIIEVGEVSEESQFVRMLHLIRIQWTADS